MRNWFVIIVTVFLLAQPGCMYRGYYPNGYYTGGGPGVLPAQPWPGNPYQPGGPVYQQPTYQPGFNSTPMGAPTFDSTPGNSPTINQPTDPNNPQTYGPGSAPTFNPTTPGGSNSGGVPTPDDGSDFGRGPTGSNKNLLTPTTNTSSISPSDMSTPFKQEESRLPRSFDDEGTAATDDPFTRPVVQTSGAATGNVQQADSQSPNPKAGAKTYDHHPKFAWIQGPVEFDDATGTWVIMYDDNPPPNDPFGGELTISSNVSRYRLRSGDIVRIAGAVDQTLEDSRGKPVYQLSDLRKLPPGQ